MNKYDELFKSYKQLQGEVKTYKSSLLKEKQLVEVLKGMLQEKALSEESPLSHEHEDLFLKDSVERLSSNKRLVAETCHF